jgi:OmpA-OmpF porin, OOP family
LFHSQSTQHASDTLGEFPTVWGSADGAGAGVGLGYDFNRHIGISLNYDVFETRANGIYEGHFNTSIYGDTFEYRF